MYIVNEKQEKLSTGKTAKNAGNPDNEIVSWPVIPINGKPDADLLIMFSNQKAQGMNAPDKDFFINILKAAGKKPADVAALNTAGVKNAKWQDIAETSRAKTIIAFGIEDFLLPENIVTGEIKEDSGKQILAVEALSIVSADKDKKRVLWNGMQKLFNL